MVNEEPDLGHVFNSLKNSRIRKESYDLVCDAYPGELTSREIATKLHCSERDVVGALIGDGDRYKKEDSLTGMGVAETHERMIHGYRMLLFSATALGLKIKEQNNLKNYSYHTKTGLENKENTEKETETTRAR